jgi:gliding motility-associated-like protein
MKTLILLFVCVSFNSLVFGQTENTIAPAKETDCLLRVPNIFTPNGDSYYKCLEPEYNCPYDSLEFIIFNRWGEIIFESNDDINCWDGSYNGKVVQDGTYIWSVRLYNSEGKSEYRGNITVVR